ncbi:MAG TPA: hypothetical protein VHG91_18340, partial [Longimicrobium sp.]|nr:hypothetical protein [Longimicrobium sp.]
MPASPSTSNNQSGLVFGFFVVAGLILFFQRCGGDGGDDGSGIRFTVNAGSDSAVHADSAAAASAAAAAAADSAARVAA